MEFLMKSKYWQRSKGRDHVFPMTHPNAFRFLRNQVNGSIQVVVDFGRHPKQMYNLNKDVVSLYAHVVDSYTNDEPQDPYKTRSTLLFFRGRTFRKDEGIVRAKLAKILTGYDDVHYERSIAIGENIIATIHQETDSIEKQKPQPLEAYDLVYETMESLIGIDAHED